MKAYVAKNSSGEVTRGWLLKEGTSIDSSMCRLPRGPAEEKVEEVSVEAAVRSAAQTDPIGGLAMLPAKQKLR